ncbi:MAG: hypothetical protein ACRD98_00570 [Nitrososphaera sp.]
MALANWLQALGNFPTAVAGKQPANVPGSPGGLAGFAQGMTTNPLLQMGLGIMAQNVPSQQPQNFASILSRGMMGGMQNIAAAQESQQIAQYRQAQMQQQEAQASQEAEAMRAKQVREDKIQKLIASGREATAQDFLDLGYPKESVALLKAKAKPPAAPSVRPFPISNTHQEDRQWNPTLGTWESIPGTQRPLFAPAHGPSPLELARFQLEQQRFLFSQKEYAARQTLLNAEMKATQGGTIPKETVSLLHKEYITKSTSFNKLENALAKLKKSMEDYPNPALWRIPGKSRDIVQTDYINVINNLRSEEFSNTGVMNVGDWPLIQQSMANPTEAMTYFTRDPYAQLGELHAISKTGRELVNQTYGRFVSPELQKTFDVPTPKILQTEKPVLPTQAAPEAAVAVPQFREVIDDDTGKTVRARLDPALGKYYIERGGQKLYMVE